MSVRAERAGQVVPVLDRLRRLPRPRPPQPGHIREFTPALTLLHFVLVLPHKASAVHSLNEMLRTQTSLCAATHSTMAIYNEDRTLSEGGHDNHFLTAEQGLVREQTAHHSVSLDISIGIST